MTISIVNGVNPLQTTLLELGIVSGRVALLLRSAEIQPLFLRFVTLLVRCWSRVGLHMQAAFPTAGHPTLVKGVGRSQVGVLLSELVLMSECSGGLGVGNKCRIV